MTESDWLNYDSADLLLERNPLRLDDRRRRLLACGICRQFEGVGGDEVLQATLDVAEAFADGSEPGKRLAKAQREAARVARISTGTVEGLTAAWQAAHSVQSRRDLSEQALEAAQRAVPALLVAACADTSVDGFYAPLPHPGQVGALLNGCRADRIDEQASVVRDVLGNPFRRPAIDPAWLSWRDGFIAGLARDIYENRRFEDLPILGDALEDAGCADRTILTHCHEPGVHVRGCWVLDRLLGRTRPPRAVHTEALLASWPERYCTPLDPVICQGAAGNRAVRMSLRLESANLPEAIRFVSEVDPADLPEAERSLYAAALPTLLLSLRQRLAAFPQRGRPLAGVAVGLVSIHLAPLPLLSETVGNAVLEALDRGLQEAVLVPLEASSRGPARTAPR